MDGSWLTETGPSTEEVIKLLKNQIHMNTYTFPLKTCPHLLKWYNRILPIVANDVVMDELKKGCTAWGSYRGYYYFTHGKLLTAIRERLDFAIQERARDIIGNFLKLYWIPHMLYRAPSPTTKAGLRYKSIENEFNVYASDQLN